MYGIKLLNIILVVLLFQSCAPKKFTWQGQYITITTAEQPKVDFEVGEYIVVAYAPIEYKKNPDIIYRFSIYKNEKQIGLITVEYHLELPILSTGEKMYLLEENNYSRKDEPYYLIQSGNKMIYQVYEGTPTYKQARGDVLTILLGGELVPPPPFDNEEAKKMLYLIQ